VETYDFHISVKPRPQKTRFLLTGFLNIFKQKIISVVRAIEVETKPVPHTQDVLYGIVAQFGDWVIETSPHLNAERGEYTTLCLDFCKSRHLQWLEINIVTDQTGQPIGQI
jgi:hypothetical protein